MRITRDDLAGNYVECGGCGHPIEHHDGDGCQLRTEGCDCRDSWTRAEVRRVRQREGLTGTYNPLHY